MSVCLTCGSRGIDNIVAITRAVVEFCRERGAVPFAVPAMGSHGGATAQGQLDVLHSFGITEVSIGCPIRSSMETTLIGTTEDGRPVHIDHYAAALMPSLGFESCDVLIVDEIGKNISGCGMDPNIPGVFATPGMTGGIDAQRRCILSLTPQTHGNGYGMGAADAITRRQSSCACAPAIGQIRIICVSFEFETLWHLVSLKFRKPWFLN